MIVCGGTLGWNDYGFNSKKTHQRLLKEQFWYNPFGEENRNNIRYSQTHLSDNSTPNKII